MSDAASTSGNPFIASTVAPGVLNLTPPGSPCVKEVKVGTSDLPVPTGAELYVLGEKDIKPGVSESTLACLLKGLPVADGAGEAAGKGGVLQLLKQLLATKGKAQAKPKPNAVEKALSMYACTLVVQASLAYPVLWAAATDSALRAMMIVELVLLSLEDGGGVVLPMGLHTHPLPLDQWREFKENLAGLLAQNLPQVQ